jgi:hypothetical protein
MAFGRSGKFGPFAREAEPEQPVALGPGDAGKPATNIRLLAQILAVCKLSMHRRASHMRRHADTLHPINSPVVAREPHSCQSTRILGFKRTGADLKAAIENALSAT